MISKVLIFTIFFMFACSENSSKIIKDKKKITFIFDFDATMYSNKKINGSYISLLYREIALRYNKKKSEEIRKYIEINHSFAKTPIDAAKLMFDANNKFGIIITKSDIVNTGKNLIYGTTTDFREIIRNLKKDGYSVLVIGGAAFGCAIIPEFAKQFKIEKSDIYSGYFKNFSEKSIKKSLIFDDFQYVNCANPDKNTVFSTKKSELIRLLKEQGKITGKVIHIGDGKNDLEVWQAGEADVFIGFGVNRVDKDVEKDSPIYVKTIDEFKTEINKIISVNQK